METDDRFKHLAADPRFKTLRRKQRKVQIDERFQSMFTDDKFTLKYTKDKRGRNQKKTSGDDLKKYYSLEQSVKEPPKKSKEPKKEDKNKKTKKKEEEEEEVEEVDEEEEEEEDEEAETEVDSEDGEEDESKVVESGEEEEEDDDDDESRVESEAEETPESELSSSSDESESEVEDEADPNEVDVDKIEYDWQPLDHDAETADISTKRLAIQNLDWDRIDVKDLYTLVNSIRPPISVKVYVSEFGKERLKEEELHGPKEIVEMKNVDEEEEEEYNLLKDKMEALNNPKPKSQRVHEYEDADDELNPKNEEIRERIRRYQLSKMKYYYAVAEFESVESAELVYKELDGMEYEGSSLELDLRFIPDDIEFDENDVKATCDKLPDLTTYKAPQFISTALQQTTVKFTWDETDIKRQEKLHKAYTKEELEKDDLEAYLASETESEEEEEDDEGGEHFNDTVSVVTANSEARVNKYKQLLKSLEEEENKKKKVDVDIEWGNYSEDEAKVGSGSDAEQEEEPVDWDEAGSDSEGSSDNESFSKAQKVRGKKEREKERVDKKGKEKKSKKKGKSKKRGDVEEESDNDNDQELDLLVMDTSKPRDDFKFDPDDARFNAVYESGLYNIDPSHPNFKRTQAFDLMAERKREKRRKTSS